MKKKLFFKLLIFIALISLIIFGLYKSGIDLRHLDINTLVKYIRNCGRYKIMCFIAICALKPLMVFLPAAMFSIVGGIIFGSIEGFMLNMLGFFLSGTIAFFISRYLGKNVVDKIVRGKALKLNSNLERNGFKILFLLRLPPVLPYDPLSYACGLTKMKYWDFIFASVLGVVPETFCYSYMGQNILSPFSPKFIIPLVIIIIATVTSTIVFKKANNG